MEDILKQAILDASNWEQYLTEQERTTLKVNKAKELVLDRVFNKHKELCSNKKNQLLEHKDFIVSVLNGFWNDLQLKLQQDNLGTIERKLYESEAKKAKDLIDFIMDDKHIPNKLMLKKRHVQVLIDSEEKKEQAIQILQKHNEEIWDDEEAMRFDEKYHFLVFGDTTGHNWYVTTLRLSRSIVTLEELDLILTNERHEK